MHWKAWIIGQWEYWRDAFIWGWNAIDELDDEEDE